MLLSKLIETQASGFIFDSIVFDCALNNDGLHVQALHWNSWRSVHPWAVSYM